MKSGLIILILACTACGSAGNSTTAAIGPSPASLSAPQPYMSPSQTRAVVYDALGIMGLDDLEKGDLTAKTAFTIMHTLAAYMPRNSDFGTYNPDRLGETLQAALHGSGVGTDQSTMADLTADVLISLGFGHMWKVSLGTDLTGLEIDASDNDHMAMIPGLGIAFLNGSKDAYLAFDVLASGWVYSIMGSITVPKIDFTQYAHALKYERLN